MVEEHDFLVYHLGSGPKFVKHAFERSCALAYPPDEEARALLPLARARLDLGWISARARRDLGEISARSDHPHKPT